MAEVEHERDRLQVLASMQKVAATDIKPAPTQSESLVKKNGYVQSLCIQEKEQAYLPESVSANGLNSKEDDFIGV